MVTYGDLECIQKQVSTRWQGGGGNMVAFGAILMVLAVIAGAQHPSDIGPAILLGIVGLIVLIVASRSKRPLVHVMGGGHGGLQTFAAIATILGTIAAIIALMR
jgi:hypothetical protein